MKRGYSLIEMLVVLGVFAILGVVITQTLASSLSSSRKSEAVTNAKENVDYAINVMERTLRNSKEIQCSPDLLTLNYKNIWDDNLHSFSIENCHSSDAHIASYSGTTSTSVNITSEDVEIICDGASRFDCSGGTVEIYLTAEDINSTGKESGQYSSSTRVYIRNY